MGRLAGSFLLRCWQMGADEERYEVEHIQSGARTVAASPGAAWAWIADRVAAVNRESPGDEAEPPGGSPGEARQGGPKEEPRR